MKPSQQAILFLINVIFDSYLLVLMIRFILCWARADYFNPIIQMIIQLTQPLVAPIRRLLPTTKGIEISTLVIMLILDAFKFFLVGLVILGLPNNFLGLFVLGLADLLRLFFNILFFSIIAQAVLSFFQPSSSQITQLLNKLTSPVLRPVRKYIPPIKGYDISPIPVLIVLQLLIILLVQPLAQAGQNIAFGGVQL